MPLVSVHCIVILALFCDIFLLIRPSVYLYNLSFFFLFFFFFPHLFLLNCLPYLSCPHSPTSLHPFSILHLYPSSLSNTDLFLSSVSVELLDMPHIDQSRNTALHLACLQGHEECALAILEKCNDDLIHVSNTAGKT